MIIINNFSEIFQIIQGNGNTYICNIFYKHVIKRFPYTYIKPNSLFSYINWGFHRVSNCKIRAINVNLNGSEGETEKMRSSSPKRYNLAGNRAIFSQTHWGKRTKICIVFYLISMPVSIKVF